MRIYPADFTDRQGYPTDLQICIWICGSIIRISGAVHTDMQDCRPIHFCPADFTDLQGYHTDLWAYTYRQSMDLGYGAILRTLRSVWLYIQTVWAEIREVDM